MGMFAELTEESRMLLNLPMSSSWWIWRNGYGNILKYGSVTTSQVAPGFLSFKA